MRTGQSPNLPIAPDQYLFDNEQTMRRTVEQYLEDLRSDVVANRDGIEKNASLALRRHQFLLMGARNG